jgi:hypothetical protein
VKAWILSLMYALKYNSALYYLLQSVRKRDLSVWVGSLPMILNWLNPCAGSERGKFEMTYNHTKLLILHKTRGVRRVTHHLWFWWISALLTDVHTHRWPVDGPAGNYYLIGYGLLCKPWRGRTERDLHKKEWEKKRHGVYLQDVAAEDADPLGELPDSTYTMQICQRLSNSQSGSQEFSLSHWNQYKQ